MNAPLPSIAHILVLKADRLCAEALRSVAQGVFPAAEISEAHLISDARLWLTAASIDLLLTGTTMLDGDVADLLSSADVSKTLPRRVLVVTGSRQPRVLQRFQPLANAGIFDSFDEHTSALVDVLHRVAAGETYWSPSVRERLSAGSASCPQLCRMLTLTEQLVLSVIGDGSDDLVAAARLGLTPSTVQSVRRGLHRKLGVQQKGELIQLAARLGYVVFTADGVVRPGFAQLLDAWRARHEKSEAGARKIVSRAPRVPLDRESERVRIGSENVRMRTSGKIPGTFSEDE